MKHILGIVGFFILIAFAFGAFWNPPSRLKGRLLKQKKTSMAGVNFTPVFADDDEEPPVDQKPPHKSHGHQAP